VHSEFATGAAAFGWINGTMREFAAYTEIDNGAMSAFVV
jgi:hypothetical protein